MATLQDGFDAGGGTAVLEPPLTAPAPTRRPGPRRRAGGPPPPRDPGDGDGGGGGGGGGHWHDGGDGSEPQGAPQRPSGSAELAFALLLGAIFTLFLVFLGAFVYVRRQEAVWPPPHSVSTPPEGLWLSTLVLAASSAAMLLAVRAWRGVRAQRALTWLDRATWSGLAFLAVQAWLWRDLFARGLVASSDAYAMIFYSLTGLHAVHVVAGLAGMLYARRSVRQVVPCSGRRGAIEFCALYWHFMGALWVVLFAVLYFLH